MAATASSMGGSTWINFILNALHITVPANAALKFGLPIKMRTRSVPLHLPTVLTEAKDGVLLDAFDGIPLYLYGAAAQNKLYCMYPDGTETQVSVTQE